MYGVPGGGDRRVLEVTEAPSVAAGAAAAAAAATGTRPLGPQPFCSRRGTPATPQPHNHTLHPNRGALWLSSGPASTPTSGSSRPESGCWQPQLHHQQQQQQQIHNQHYQPNQQLYDIMPRRNDLAASPMSRRGSVTGGRPPPMALKVLLPGSSCDFSDAADAVADVLGSSSLAGGGGGATAVMSSGSSLHLNHYPLSSLVPDGDNYFDQDPQQLLMLGHPPSSASCSRRRALGSPQGPLHHHPAQPQSQPVSACCSPGTYHLLLPLRGARQNAGLGLEAVGSGGPRTGTAGSVMGSLFPLPRSGSGISSSSSSVPPRTGPWEVSLPVQLPSTPSDGCSSPPGPSLRAASSVALQQPQSPAHSCYSGAAFGGDDGGGAAAGVLTAAELTVSSSSYKSQMRRLRGAVSALDGGGMDGCLERDDIDGEDEDEDEHGGNAGGCFGGTQRFTQLQEQSSRARLLDDDAPPSRRAGTPVWGPVAESVPGSVVPGGAAFGGRTSGPVSSSASCPAKPASGSSTGTGIGYSRRHEDLPAAPYPAYSRSLGGSGGSGGGGSTPGTAGTQATGGVGGSACGRVSLAWQLSINSSAGSASSSSIGFSRRLEDLPAAPSPSNSRSLAAGGGRSSGSASSMPASPAASGGGPNPPQHTQTQQQQQHIATTWPNTSGDTPMTPHPPNATSAASSSPLQLPQPSVRRGALGSVAASVSASDSAFGEVSAAHLQPHPTSSSMTIHSTGSCRSARLAFAVGALAPAGPATRPSPTAAAAAAVAPKPPPLQRVTSQGIGFSRRPEDLPAAPSPSNSRSLVGGGGGGSSSGDASSTHSWCSPRTPPSPAASDAASRSVKSRRPEDLPAAPHPSQSRSLRPDSSRAMFRSHASGLSRGSVTPPALPSTRAWGQPIGGGSEGGRGGDGLVLSLGLPSPVVTLSSCDVASHGGGGGEQQQQRGLQAGGATDDVIDLPVMQGGITEDLCD